MLYSTEGGSLCLDPLSYCLLFYILHEDKEETYFQCPDNLEEKLKICFSGGKATISSLKNHYELAILYYAFYALYIRFLETKEPKNLNL